MGAGDDWVVDATAEAVRRLLEHAGKVGLANTEEFTLRAMFMAAAHDRLTAAGRQPRFHTEWHHFDLLIQVDDDNTVIEFKYYLLRHTTGLHGEFLSYKGGASLQNEREFDNCVTKLRTLVPAGIGDARLVLVYGTDTKPAGIRSFHHSYATLASTNDLDVAPVWVDDDRLAAMVLRPHRP